MLSVTVIVVDLTADKNHKFSPTETFELIKSNYAQLLSQSPDFRF